MQILAEPNERMKLQTTWKQQCVVFSANADLEDILSKQKHQLLLDDS